MAENSAAGTAVGDSVSGTPYDDGDDQTDDALTYALTGEAATSGAFEIDSATGQISVKQGATIDFEAKSSYTGSVTWTVQGQEAFADVTIGVIDLEAGKPDAPTVTRAPFTEPTNPALDVTWTAPAKTGAAVTWYEVQYRKQAAEGEQAAEWTRYSERVLQRKDTSLRLSNLESGATYEVQVRAQTDDEGPGPWSDIGSGRANRPPQVTVLFVRDASIPVWQLTASQSLMGKYFEDPDSDALSWIASSEYQGIGLAWIQNHDGGPRVFTKFVNPGTTTFTYGAHDAYGGYASRTFTVTGILNPKRTILENSPAGTAVGHPVAGTPHDDGDDETDDALTYTLTGEAATSGAFVIDSATGQISVQEDANLDFETKSSYAGKVNWTVQGQAVAANLTISLTDLEVGQPAAPTVTRTEFGEPANPALDVTWTAPDANGTTITGYEIQYRKQVADGETPNAWTTHTYTDANEVVTSRLPASPPSVTVPNLDAGATYEFQVRAVTSLEGEGPWSDAGTGRANRPPSLTARFLTDYTGTWGREVAENISNVFQDADGDTLTYSASSSRPAVVSVRMDGADIYSLIRNPGSTTISYGAHDPYGGYVARTFNMTGRANETRSIAENSAAGTAVGDPVTGTPYDDGDDETNDALTYTLTGAAATSGNFEIDAASGQISVTQGASLNYESESSYTGKVEYTVNGYATAINVTIDVTDVEAAKPDAPTVTRTRFDEETNPALDVTWTAPAANGATITGYEVQYRKKVADGETPEAWTAYTYTDANENVTSQLPAATLSINLPDLDAGATYEFQVRALTALEGEGPWSDIGEGQANQPPTTTDLALQDLEIVRAAQANEPVDAGYFLDPDGDDLSFSASTERLGVLTAGIADVDSGAGEVIPTLSVEGINPGSSTVTYGAHDEYGGYASRTITVTVTDFVRRSVGDKSPAGTLVGEPVTGTPYGEEPPTFTYTLTGEAADSGAFVIDSATGQISVAEGATVNYATKSSYTGQATYTVQGQPAVIDITIEVIPVHEVSIALPATFKNLHPLDVTFTFGTDVTGFDATDVTVENGTLGTLSGSGAVYAATVTPNGDGDVTVTVAAGAALAASGTLAPQTATSKVSTYLWLRLEGPSGTRKSWDSFEVVATFSQPPGDDFSFRPWNSTPPVPVSVDGNTATFTLTPEYYGYRWGTWPYRTRLWVNWRGLGAYFEVYSDGDRPRVHRIIGPSATQRGPFSIHVQLTEDVVGIEAEDLAVVNGEVTGFRRVYGIVRPNVAGWFYEADITPTRSGRLTVDIAASEFRDGVGWGNRAARQWSVNVDLSPPAPDQPSVTQSASAPTTSLDVAWTAPDTGTGLPIIDYDVWYRKPGEANWTDHPFISTATQTTITGLTPETTYQVQVRAVNADSPGAWSPTAEGVTAADNRAPQFARLVATRAVPENSPAGTPVGDPVTAVDDEDHPVTYTLREASSLFELDPETGQLSVAEGASLDFEAGESYTLVIEASDGLDVTWTEDDHSVDAEVTVAITVIDVAEPPDQPEAPAVTPATAQPLSVLEVTWTAPANDGRPAIADYDLRYRQVGASEWSALDFVGVGTATALPDLEPGTSYEVQVAASNDEGTSPWSDAGVGHTEADNVSPKINPPEDGGDRLIRAIAENSPAGARVGVAIAVADGNGDALTFALTGASAFVIDAASGQIRVAEGAVLDYETRTSYSVTITVSDGKDANHQPDAATDDTVDVTIEVLDQAPPARPDAPSVAPSAAQPTVVLHVTWTAPANQGRPAITDYDLRYRQVGAASWTEHAFDGVGTMTWISDLDPDTAYEVQVAAANVEGLGPWSDAGEGRTSPAADGGPSDDGNNPPSFRDEPGDSGTVREVAENAPGGTLVGAPIAATDSDGDALTYALSGATEFVIDAATGQIRVAAGAALDYETTTAYTLTVSVTDGKDAQGNPDASVDATVAVTINVLDQLPPARPAAPSVEPVAAQPTTVLQVTWTAPTNDGRPAITDYDVRYRALGASAWASHSFAGVTTTTRIPGLELDTAYEVQVAAANLEGLGPWSDVGTGRTASPDDASDPNGPDGPDGSNSPNGPGNPGNPGGNAGNPASTNPPSGSSSGISSTTVQSRASVGASEPTQPGFGVFSPELGASMRTDAAVNRAGSSLLSGLAVWTPEKALVFSFLGPGLLGLLGMLSTLLKWKLQMSLWTALLAGLAAIFLFFWRRTKEKEDDDPVEAVGMLRPAT
ncbi:MAG: fibronectin type III domain-containing protein [Chloroflexota bacterium]|nr:fibronectin type III domain-containing protein [Chloroflexota bacterium]